MMWILRARVVSCDGIMCWCWSWSMSELEALRPEPLCLLSLRAQPGTPPMHENLQDWRRIAFQVRHPRHREGDGARPPVPWRYDIRAQTTTVLSETGTGPWRCSATQVRLPGVHEHLHGGCDLASPLEASAESLQVSMKLEFELEGCSIWEG